MGGSVGVMSELHEADYRIERCKRNFNIPQQKIDKLWSIYCRYDREGKHYVTVNDFFDRIIKFPQSSLTDSIFTLLDTKSDVTMTFGEFVETICTFSCFEKTELLQFFFFILDTQKTGLVEKNEVKHFIDMIWNHELNSNSKEALRYLDSSDDGDGTFNFKEILALQDRYPNIFYPIYKLQTQIIITTLGEWWWNRHKAKLVDTKEKKREAQLAALRKQQNDERAASNAVTDEVVLRRMGHFKYYCMPWLRAQERTRIAKIAAIEAQLEKFDKGKKKGVDDDDDNEEQGDD